MKIGDERRRTGSFDSGLDDASRVEFELEKMRREALQIRRRATNSWFDFMFARRLFLAAFEREPERGHLVVVANQQHVAGKYRVIPGLALERRKLC
jgi:hypothetical protein